MPNSFSRFLTPEELKEVRAVYLKSLEAEGFLDAPAIAEPDAPARVEGPT